MTNVLFLSDSLYCRITYACLKTFRQAFAVCFISQYRLAASAV
ncbi:hypothetical protein HMPREF9370_1353 [Neisseria wadsworthii 9715]|uniref:Uncharacterized protein n=1 Tax=Neisseria wadsworthii 9715 TaxID=1030841 RepID=G4CQJ3_9NEIS|nr:hypothetical protein HMPREF9370_1353 [Neisseria wadsworthii 9715]